MLSICYNMLSNIYMLVCSFICIEMLQVKQHLQIEKRGEKPH